MMSSHQQQEWKLLFTTMTWQHAKQLWWGMSLIKPPSVKPQRAQSTVQVYNNIPQPQKLRSWWVRQEQQTNTLAAGWKTSKLHMLQKNDFLTPTTRVRSCYSLPWPDSMQNSCGRIWVSSNCPLLCPKGPSLQSNSTTTSHNHKSWDNDESKSNNKQTLLQQGKKHQICTCHKLKIFSH